MGSVLYKVIGPDMVGMFGSQPNAGAVVQPKPALLCLFLRDFKPFPPPDPLDTLVIYVPASIVQQARDHPIAVAAELPRQLDDVLGQPFFIWQAAGHLALRRTMLPECAADPALRYAKGLPHMDNTLTAAGRAQKFCWRCPSGPRAASFKINFSIVRSDTARLRRWFSVSSSFSRFN